jgi:SPP1 family predicted phage head-tail adaptor
MIGELRNLIEVQRASTTPSKTGQPLNTFTTIAMVWAGIVAQSATETQTQQQTKALTHYEITMRYREFILPTDRLKKDDTIYNIVGVVPDRKKTYLTIEATSAS